MKLQHLTVAAFILLTIACNSNSSSSTGFTSDTTAVRPADTSSMGAMNDTSMMMGSDTSMHHMMQMCVVMEKGKMMVMDSGKTSPMTAMITMDNGTKVDPNGTYTTSDGKKDKLKDGECIMKDGSKTTMDKMPM